ncbi:alcohol oxidase [Desarmillaria tabescens]|uniref:Alcohol oxidase n=1 Tax=Armillaria tabescens TaxID=1929756 RepID=A0AA39JWU5_ARMTA|nr:alcohol oxidase [Desarmillaria tabescens]KAK0450396.1 alcohol oxidase [Desarmillaria tabescens]
MLGSIRICSGIELGDVSRSAAPTYDYIIVGGGTAGCCLASRLSEDPNVTVLLIERGGVADTWANTVPLISSNIFKKDGIAKPLDSEPQKHADDRVIALMRGQALGGTSRVNGMAYTRDVAADFNRWRDMGHPDWSYEKMLPFFVKSEAALSHPDSKFRGKKGPWVNQTFPHAKEAAKSFGIPFYPDCNDPSLPSISCAPIDITVNQNMRRCSTYSAFLPPPLARSRKDRLKICTDTVAERLVFSHNSEGRPRATGVEFGHRDGTGVSYFAKARKEVVVSCGALESAQLLLLSGIGPANHLKSYGIEVVLDNPGVGNNLKDHVDVPVMWNIPLGESIHVILEKPWRACAELFKYLLSRKGVFSDPFVHEAIFLPSRFLNLDATLPKNRPDLEIKPMPIYGMDPPRNATTVHVKEGVMNFMVCLLQPKSSGFVRLNSPDPYDKVKCDLGMLSDPEDIAILTKGVRLSLNLAEQIQAQGYPIKTYHRPSSDPDADIETYIRAYARSGYHYSSTCWMAPFDSTHLAHPMAPIVAIAEKCAWSIRSAQFKSK